ncbi:MAG: alpha-amylase [Spirochaetes bacterium DG_61]|jgi:maltose alpha-D-glucosyltransferase/alpha-amylase|nr:MAG: alpha-amylase [Spirochaetes bacterium DG_61]
MSEELRELENDPHWYKDAIIYQLHVKAFRDTNASGMGDFRGLMEKLDYLEGLGITALWILPFYPSPGKDDGYDISDYFNVLPDYGTLRDFRTFLKAAHRRGIRVITELVLNHTSDQHSWFQRARHAPRDSKFRDFYVWSDTPDRYQEARIIFTDFENSNWSWDPVAKAYYWHRFYSHQPDLNFNNSQVQMMMRKVIDFWLGMGVDGLRLDAVPYLYEREGTNCENLSETYEFLRKLRSYVDSRYSNRMLLAEANQWPEDAVAYFGNGDICHTAFHFPLMPRMYIALQMEDRFPVIDILDQTPSIPELCQWVIFLRNHDELTLEMVTDEERDYMYRSYARDPRARINLGIRRRLAPLLSNNRRMIELLNVLLLSLPGTPVIYYGDEIGMGDNYYLGDRNGVRTPMQWSPGKNAGFSNVNPQKLYLPVIIDPEYNYEAINVETQQANPSSLLWWMKRSIATRKGLRCFGRGSLKMLYPENPRILAFLREYSEERVLVVVNLSQFSQAVELDLSAFSGVVPIEIFSKNRFPVIKETPYQLTLGGHSYFWFLLEGKKTEIVLTEEKVVPEINCKASWKGFPDAGSKRQLETTVLLEYLKKQRWFREKSYAIQKLQIRESISIHTQTGISHIFLVEAIYIEGSSSTYLIPVSFAVHEWAGKISSMYPQSILARLKTNDNEGFLYDALFDENFCFALLRVVAGRSKITGKDGEAQGFHSTDFHRLLDERGLVIRPRVASAEQSNSSILYEDMFILKLYRKIEAGKNPELEIVQRLTEKAHFKNIPPFAGAIIYRSSGLSEASFCLLQRFVQNQGDGWIYTLNSLTHFFNKILAEKPEKIQVINDTPIDLTLSLENTPDLLIDYIGSFFLEMMGLLGHRTAELHLALASLRDDPAFRPEPFSTLFLRALYQSMRSQTRRMMDFLKKNLRKLPEAVRDDAEKVAGMEDEILRRQHMIMERKMEGLKIRTHGDYHLGQIMFTGKDFMIIDFEGEPARPLSERKLKRSPLRDIAGMIRSFHYAVYTAFRNHVTSRPEDTSFLKPWTDVWFKTVRGIFLSSYMASTAGSNLVSSDGSECKILLEAYLLEKGVYELWYELNNRPDWVAIPIAGLLNILVSDEKK